MQTTATAVANMDSEGLLNRVEEFIDGSLHSENLSQEIQISTLSTFIKDDQLIETITPPTLCVSIILEGRGWFSIDHGPELRVVPGTVVIFHATKPIKGRTLFEANHNLHCLDLRFRPEYLKKFGVKSLEHLAPMYQQNASYKGHVMLARPASIMLKKLAQEIFYSEMNDLSRRVYLQAKALEILANVLQVLQDKRKLPISKADEKKVTQAITLLESSYEQNWTIAKLANEVCLNEGKLKKGFHLIVQSTIHQFLEEKRLSAAQNLLSHGQRVTDVALSVGYANPSHFTKRFKGRFGITPNRWRFDKG